MLVWNVLHLALWKYSTEKIAKNLPSAHHRTTSLGYVCTAKACIHNREIQLLNSNTSSTCPHNMVNFSPLTIEIDSLVCITPANVNRFRILVSLLHRHRSPQANQTLHNVWPSPGMVHYIHISRGSCPLTELWQVKNSLCVQILHSAILAVLLLSIVSDIAIFVLKRDVKLQLTNYCSALEQLASAKLCGMPFQQRMSPLFGRSAVMLGIGPHSSLLFLLCWFYRPLKLFTAWGDKNLNRHHVPWC